MRYLLRAPTIVSLIFLRTILSACGAEEEPIFYAPKIDRNEVVIIGQDFHLRSNEVARSVVVIGGDVIIDGEVRDGMVAVGGSVQINGRIGRRMVVVLGPVSVGPTGDVAGEAVVVGGPLKASPGARLSRRHVKVITLGQTPNILWLRDWFAQGFLMGRPFPPGVSWSWVLAGLMLSLYLVTALVFTRPVTACAAALDKRPAGSILAGILGVVLFGPVCLLLLVSVIGIPVVPVLFCAVLVGLFFGKIAMCSYIGSRLLGQFSSVRGPHPAISVLVGGTILYLAYMVPILGFLLWGLGTIWALGAVLVTFFGTFRRESASSAPSPILASPIPVTPGIGIPPVSEGSVPPISAPPVPGAIYYQRAGFWMRLFASLLDLILIGGLGFLLAHFVILIFVAYHVAMWTWRGSTIGGIVLGLKVVRTDGQPINFAVALVRSLASIFSALILFIGFFWAGWDSEKQSWHDKIAGTVVVKVPKGVSLI